MSLSLSKSSISLIWLTVVTILLWRAMGTTSVVAWVALALIGVMPPVVLMLLTQTPERTTAEVIRDVDAGRSI